MKATNALTEMRSIITSFASALDVANQYTDPELSPQGLQNERTRLRSRAQDMHRARIEELRSAVTAEAARSATAADRALEAETRIRGDRTLQEGQEWQLVILPQLAAGKQLEELLPTLSMDGVNAARRFGPAHITTNAQSLEDKVAAEQRIADFEELARQTSWGLLGSPASSRTVQEASALQCVAQTVDQFAGSVPLARDAASLSAASTFLTTASSPSFNSGFSELLTTEAA